MDFKWNVIYVAFVSAIFSVRFCSFDIVVCNKYKILAVAYMVLLL